tara:strand:+ start:5524 stop:6000 length:477 start_codon:yes stop_codon:yes gene_type:complete
MCKSTEYYRKNKENRKVVHKCQHCDYSTTGPKTNLKHHVLAKHTPENERPYQCPHKDCCRGFARKIHLQHHLCKVHNEKKQVGRKKTVLYYIVNRTEKIPTSKKTRVRMGFYDNHNILTQDIIKRNISMSNLHYDMRNGYIEAKPITENDILSSVIVS